MKAHVIENNKVVNTIEVDSLEFADNLVEATEGGIGWSYNDGVFTEPADTRTDEEKAEASRFTRDSLLAATDWRAGSDLTMSDEWKAYRQALRDIPAQAGFPNSITWPTEPS
jgi:hypothetical protein